MKIILVGSTGLVGQEVLKQLIADPAVTQVVTPVRNGNSVQNKQNLFTYDFKRGENCAIFKGADAFICTLGTTLKKAGTPENFRLVDHDYPLHFARIAKENGVPHFILNSAMGASAQSKFFYNRVKGEVEDHIRELNLHKLSIVRPGLIGGKRNELRPLEYVSQSVIGFLSFLLPKSLRINPASRIAQVICAELKQDFQGQRIIKSDQMT